jgi:outer membrane protein assembly factor BamB
MPAPQAPSVPQAPEGPYGREGPYSYVDPTWAPPTSGDDHPQPPAEHRRGWLPLLVVIMVTVLVAGGLLAAERAGAPGGPTAATQYLPGDGAVTYQRRDTTIGSTTTSSQHVQESARQGGALVLAGLDYTLGLAVGRVVGFDDLAHQTFWRTTSTMIGNLGPSQQDVRIYRVDGDVALLADSGQGGADVYSPALVELPAQVTAGDRWSGEGKVGARRYRSDFQAAEAEPGCLRVSGTLVESTSTGQPITSRELVTTWCRGRGQVLEQSTRGQVVTTTMSVARPAADPTLRTVDESWTWSDPATWRRRDFDLLSSDASLGTGIMTGAASGVAPVLTASGLVFRVTNADDVVATTPKTADRWVSLWRMHPGGTIVSMAAFGDVVVVSTSLRELVGYSDAGVRLWAVDLDDIAWWAPTRVAERQVAVGDAAGAIRVVDLLSGEVGWRQQVGGQLSAPLAAGSDTVVALDAGGSTTAFEADTGRQRWSLDVPGTKVAVLGGIVAVRNQATLEGIDLVTGRHRWLLSLTGTLDALQPFGDRLIASTQLGTREIDEDGRVRLRLPPYERVSVVGDVAVGWGVTQAEFRDRDGTLLATIDTPDGSLARALGPTLCYRQGVMLFGQGWTFTSWSDEP